MTHWAITVKLNKGKPEDVTEQDYAEWMHEINKNVHKNLVFTEYYIEKDSNGRKHLHALAIGPSRLFTKKMRQLGYHLCIDELKEKKDIDAWRSYIRKDIYDEYMFMD